MDSIFSLDVETRTFFLQSIAQSTGCSYICLWSYAPNISKHLFCLDGLYNEDDNQPSCSSASIAQILFNEYKQTLHTLDNSLKVPGLALKEGIPFLELTELDLLRRTSNPTQHQFYQQAQIKTAAFLSCRNGEMEIGMSMSHSVNLELEINNWFRLQSQFKTPDQDWQSSSSSSLQSFSVGNSPDSSPLFYTMPTSTSFLPSQVLPADAYNSFHHQNINPGSDNAEITRAMLAVISSPSPSSSAPSRKSGAFKDYTSALATTSPMKPNSGKQNMLKRSISIMRNIQLSMRDELTDDISHTSRSRLHHKITERMRRDKLNESFQELRSLLPPGSKKDKASVLSSTLEYLSNLKNEVTDLKQKNDILEVRALNVEGTNEQDVGVPSDEKVDVDITSAPTESASEEQEIEVQVTVRGDCNIIDLILDVLQLLKVKGATLLSMDADTKLMQTKQINRINFRLKIKKSEWDKSPFQEAIREIATSNSLEASGNILSVHH